MDIAGIRIYERYSIKYFLKSYFLSLIYFLANWWKCIPQNSFLILISVSQNDDQWFKDWEKLDETLNLDMMEIFIVDDFSIKCESETVYHKLISQNPDYIINGGGAYRFRVLWKVPSTHLFFFVAIAMSDTNANQVIKKCWVFYFYMKQAHCGLDLLGNWLLVQKVGYGQRSFRITRIEKDMQ